MDNSKFLREAKILFASGQIEKSIEAFAIAEKNGCDRTEVFLSRGAAQMATGNHAEAKVDFTRVLNLDSGNERAHYFRGLANVVLGEYKEAIDDLTYSLAHNSRRGIAHLARGLAYAELGNENYAALDFNSSSVFSEAELKSFKKLFGEKANPFKNTKSLLAKENAPWNNLISEDTAEALSKMF